MTFPLPTDTAHVRPRTRQYRLWKWDLGEGIERATIKVSCLIGLPWLVLCSTIGVPFPQLFMVWVVPPVLTVQRAVSRDDSGRLRLRTWVDRLDGLRPSRRRPIVNGDTGLPAAAPAIETDIDFLVVPLELPRAEAA